MTNKIEILRQELAKPEYQELVNVEQQDYSAIAQLLNNRPIIPNPVPQENVWKCPQILELFAAITPQEGIELYKIPNLVEDIRTAINERKRESLNAYFSMVQSLVRPASVSNLQALLNQEISDSNYQQNILGLSKAQELNIYPVSEIDVQGALN